VDCGEKGPRRAHTHRSEVPDRPHRNL
jgi:hypothetical protein